MITPAKEFWEIFKKTEGALSCTEAVAIMNLAEQSPPGIYLELGTYKGKSALSASAALKIGEFVLVEPEFGSLGMTFVDEIKNIRNSLLLVKPIIWYSTEYLQSQNNFYSYVFVDSGSHGEGLPMQEAVLLEDRIIPGGIIAWHDFNSQFVEVKQAYDYLLSTGKYEEIPINWDEIISYVNENNLEEGNNSWHHTEMKNPCFVGALRRK